MMFIGVVVVGLLIWGVLVFAQRGGFGSTGGEGKASPLDIARGRYAKGEISKEEFEEIKKNLI